MTDGIEAAYLETHNWGKSAKFSRSLATQWNSRPITIPVSCATRHEDHHWGAREMTGRDPDGRIWRLQARESK